MNIPLVPPRTRCSRVVDICKGTLCLSWTAFNHQPSCSPEPAFLTFVSSLLLISSQNLLAPHPHSQLATMPTQASLAVPSNSASHLIAKSQLITTTTSWSALQNLSSSYRCTCFPADSDKETTPHLSSFSSSVLKKLFPPTSVANPNFCPLPLGGALNSQQQSEADGATAGSFD